jgi:hypothetical protein
MTALHHASGNGQTRVVETICQHFPNFNLNEENKVLAVLATRPYSYIFEHLFHAVYIIF